MNPEDYPQILAALATANLPSLATADGKAALTHEQMNALEGRLSSLVAEHDEQVADLKRQVAGSEKQIADLKAQVAALEAQDGADTAHIEGSADDGMNYAARVRSDYDKLKKLA